MKQFILTGLVALSLFRTNSVFAQYSFSHFNEPYVPLQGAATFNVCGDENLTDAALGFDFPVFDLSIDSVKLHQLFLIKEIDVDGTPSGIQLFPFTASFACTDVVSEGTYLTTGSPGNRIFSVQWQNIGFMDDTIGDQYMNIQARLFEIDGSIEFHIGDAHITQENVFLPDQHGGFSALIRYNPSTTVIYNNSVCLITDAESPAMVNYSEFLDPYTVNGFPASGKVYRFERTDAGVDMQNDGTFTVSPNPAIDVVKVDFQEHFSGSVKLLNVYGEQVLTQQVNGKSVELNVSALPAGIYFLNNGYSEKGVKLVVR